MQHDLHLIPGDGSFDAGFLSACALMPPGVTLARDTTP
jgi:hypothetical protein